MADIEGYTMKRLKKEKQLDIQHYAGKNVNLNAFVDSIEKWFKERKFATQSMHAEAKWLLQARKQGILRAVTASARDFSVLINGKPDDFTVEIRTGKWINNITALIVICMLSLGLYIPFGIIITAWTKKIKEDLKAFIDLTIDFVDKASENELYELRKERDRLRKEKVAEAI